MMLRDADDERISHWLDKQMDIAIEAAKAAGWSEEGQILMIRNHMAKAYSNIQSPNFCREFIH